MKNSWPLHESIWQIRLRRRPKKLPRRHSKTIGNLNFIAKIHLMWFWCFCWDVFWNFTPIFWGNDPNLTIIFFNGVETCWNHHLAGNFVGSWCWDTCQTWLRREGNSLPKVAIKSNNKHDATWCLSNEKKRKNIGCIAWMTMLWSVQYISSTPNGSTSDVPSGGCHSMFWWHKVLILEKCPRKMVYLSRDSMCFFLDVTKFLI